MENCKPCMDLSVSSAVADKFQRALPSRVPVINHHMLKRERKATNMHGVFDRKKTMGFYIAKNRQNVFVTQAPLLGATCDQATNLNKESPFAYDAEKDVSVLIHTCDDRTRNHQVTLTDHMITRQ